MENKINNMSSKKKLETYVRIILCLIVTILFVSWEIKDYNRLNCDFFYAISNNIPTNTVIGEITKDTIVSQEFTVKGNFCGVQIFMANYGAPKTGTLNIRIESIDEKKIILDENYDISQIKDNSYHSFGLDKSIEFDKETKMLITISSPDSVNGNAITVYCSNEDVYKQGDLFINGDKQNGDIVFNNLVVNTEANMNNRFFNRLMIISLIYVFVICNIVIPLKKLYRFIFRYRYIIALALFAFCVANKLHISSVGMFDVYVQPGQGNENVVPLFGAPRAIRSDEWMVSTPRVLSTNVNGVGKYNYISMAEKTPNISVSGVFLDYSALTNPAKWGYYFLDIERAVSFQWCFNLITTFMVSFEMCLIISKRKKLLSLLGATLIGLSPFYMWWSTVCWVMTGQAAVVLTYYFMHVHKKWQRCLCGFGIGIFFSNYVIDLYPAWQVPSGILFASIVVWMLWYNRKKLKLFDKNDWGIVAGTVVFVISLVGMFLLRDMEYITAISNTVYPGERVSYGGESIHKLYRFVGNVFFPFVEGVNNSENAVFFSFYPIPVIMGAYYLAKNKKRDKLIYTLVVLSLIFSAYCITDLPQKLCKLMMFTYSTPNRMADILGFTQIYLIIAIAGRTKKEERMSSVKVGIMALFVTYLSARYTFRTSIIDAEYKQLLFVGVILAVLFTGIVSRTQKKIQMGSMIVLSMICMISGLTVHPIMKGLGVIYSKPFAKEVISIVEDEPDARWIVLNDFVRPNFLIACGARTINSTNFVPNIDLWEKLNLEEYDDVYNRYAHVVIQLTDEESSIELVTMDTIKVNLNYNQLKEMDVDYIVSMEEVEGQEKVGFDEVYNESGMFIYKVMFR